MTTSTVTMASQAKRKLVFDIGGTLAAKFALFPLSMVTSVIIARSLQPEGKGIYTSTITLVELLMLVGSPAVGKAMIYQMGRRPDAAGQVWCSAFWLQLLNGALLWTVVTVGAALVGQQLFPGIPREALLVAAPIVLFSALKGSFESSLRAGQRNHQVNAIALGFSLFFLAALATASLAHRLDPATVVFLRLLALVAAGSIGLLMLRNSLGAIRLPHIDRAIARSLLAFGVPYSLIAVLQNTSYRLDILLVQRILGSQEVGYYSICSGLVDVLWYLPFAMGFVLLPRVSSRQEKQDAAVESAMLARWAIGLTIVAAVVVGLCAEPLITILYGESYLPAVLPFRLLLIGAVANCWYLVPGTYLQGHGRLKGLVAATLVGLAINIALNLLLIPRIGLAGAAVASTISYSVTGLTTLGFFCVAARISPLDVLLPRPEELTCQASRIVHLLKSRRSGQPETPLRGE